MLKRAAAIAQSSVKTRQHTRARNEHSDPQPVAEKSRSLAGWLHAKIYQHTQSPTPARAQVARQSSTLQDYGAQASNTIKPLYVSRQYRQSARTETRKRQTDHRDEQKSTQAPLEPEWQSKRSPPHPAVADWFREQPTSYAVQDHPIHI